MLEITHNFMYCFQTTSSPPPQKKETVPEKKEEPKSVIESTEKSEVSRRDSVSYENKKDRPELKSSVMAKKSERKLYPEPQVERKVSVEAVKPVVEVIKEEVEEEVKVFFTFYISTSFFGGGACGRWSKDWGCGCGGEREQWQWVVKGADVFCQLFCNPCAILFRRTRPP